MGNAFSIVEKSRPRLIAGQDFSHRAAAAGLTHLKAFAGQHARFMSKRDAEAVHQMRVALRRLRTVIDVLSRVTSDETYQRYNESLREYANILGHGRDQDIVITMLQQIPSSFYYDPDLQEQSVYAIIAVRDKAYLQIDAALRKLIAGTLLDDLVRRFQTRSFPVRSPFSDAADPDILILDQCLEKVLKRSRKLAMQDLPRRHRLRIALKQLRYALEFLALDSASSAEARSYRKTVEKLLDRLGAANDAFTAARIAHDSLSQNDLRVSLTAGMIAGWQGRGIQDQEKILLKSFRAFKSLKPYWQSGLAS